MDQQDHFLQRLLAAEADLRAFIGSLVPDRHAREDLFQEVALALWQQMAAYDSSRPFGAWARGVATNKILQRRQHDARFPLAFSPGTIAAVLEAFDHEEELTSPEHVALSDCLQKLSPKSRELLSLRYEQGCRAPQIAQRTERSLDAVYQSLSRVRAVLAECIRSQLAIEGATP